ncbi:50S ribosomal protein L3 [candidate division WOR-3 bacterium]|nr:50S ribosomal protein L3 [candidate division WOR-3 bacterium]
MIELIGKKVGMTQIFNEKGKLFPVTVVQIEPNLVVRHKTQEKDGYNACILGFGVKKNPNRPYVGIFKSLGMKPTKILHEARESFLDWKVGKKITVSVFSEVSKVNVTGHSKGKGFAGVIKRYGFSGGPKSHGSKFHSQPGSIGTSKTPGRVYKGRKMPGRMGSNKVTVKNIKIVKLDEAKNLLFLNGQVPGPTNGLLIIKSVESYQLQAAGQTKDSELTAHNS